MRVLIADDHKLIVDGIKRALEESSDFEVVGEASSGSQVLPMVGRTNPDLVLLDLRMPAPTASPVWGRSGSAIRT
jgi:Response regulator containing CheY-like receiver domain and AraC-type DNA-binding domain